MEDPLSTRSLSEERVRPHLDSNPFLLFLYFIVFFFSFFLSFSCYETKTSWKCMKETDRKSLRKPTSFGFSCSLEWSHPQKPDTCLWQWSAWVTPGCTCYFSKNIGGKCDCRPFFSMGLCWGIQPHPSALCPTSIVSLRPQQCRVLTAQGGSGDGIRVSCEVRNESVDAQQESRQKRRVWLIRFHPPVLWFFFFEGHMQKHRKGGRGEGFTGIYLD